MSCTPFHAKYLAYELTKRCPSDSVEKLAGALSDAQVDLNPHQVEAALFAFRSPLSKGAILADEVGLGKTIEAGILLAQKWAERSRRLLVIVPANLRKQWSQELADKFFLPSLLLENRSFNDEIRKGNLNPFNQDSVIICSYQFARAKEPYIRQVPWNLVVVDEAHRLRNVYKPSNKIAQAIKSAITPFQNVRVHAIFHPWGHEKSTPSKRLEECMNILDFLGPRVPLLPPPQPVVEDVMISGDIFKTIHHLKKNGFGIKSIARRLDLDPGTVRKYLNQTEIQPYSRDCPATSSLTGLEEWLRARAPEVGFNGKILFREARGKGFAGSYSIIKRFLRPIREKERVATEATVRFETPPGLQGQVDWGSSKVWIGESRRRVHFFVLVLGFSRRLFVRAYLNEKRHNVIDGHQRAFAWFGGYPKEVLYDNARTMVMTERPPAERLNKVFADFARHHGFEVRFCRPYRPRTKGKVESGVKYVKRNFLAGRRFRDLDDLNASLEQWMREEADVRIHGTTHVTPMSRWAEESSALIPLSAVRPWQPDLEHIRRVANDSRITVGTNRYPVVPSAIGKTVAVHVEAGKIEVRNESGEVVGSHEQLHGRYQEAPMPKEFHALLAEVAKKAERADLPMHDPRWPEDDVQVRNLSIYDEVAGIKEVA